MEKVNGSKKDPCHFCLNTHYVAPYARSGHFVICSRSCWEAYKELVAKKENHEQHQIH